MATTVARGVAKAVARGVAILQHMMTDGYKRVLLTACC